MNKLSISCMLVVLLFVVPLAAFTLSNTWNVENERRQSAVFPKVPPKIRGQQIKKYFQEIDAFFADHFPLRTSLLKFPKTWHETIGDNLNIDRCYRGKDNWLFLGNAYDRAVEKLRGSISISADGLESQTEAYKIKRDIAKKFGAEFFVFIGANKSTIYPEYLPPVIMPAPQRFIAPLFDSLRKEGVKVYDSTARLIEAKKLGLLYFRTDTHWNARGAYEAFDGFREWAGLPPIPKVFYTESTSHRGDLVDIGGYDNFPLSVGDTCTPHWKNPPPPVSYEKDGRITNPQGSSGKTAWIFEDSFGGGPLPYMSTAFKEIRVFTHKEFEEKIFSSLHKPDIVLWIIVERNFAQSE